jgi:transketolase
VIARRDFGASAPVKELLKHFGFTVDNVAGEARRLLQTLGRPKEGK